jgi:hypothetical protein
VGPRRHEWPRFCRVGAAGPWLAPGAPSLCLLASNCQPTQAGCLPTQTASPCSYVVVSGPDGWDGEVCEIQAGLAQPPPLPDPPTDSDGGGLSGGAVAGVVMGAVAAVAALWLATAYFGFRRRYLRRLGAAERRRQRQAEKQELLWDVEQGGAGSGLSKGEGRGKGTAASGAANSASSASQATPVSSGTAAGTAANSPATAAASAAGTAAGTPAAADTPAAAAASASSGGGLQAQRLRCQPPGVVPEWRLLAAFLRAVSAAAIWQRAIPAPRPTLLSRLRLHLAPNAPQPSTRCCAQAVRRRRPEEEEAEAAEREERSQFGRVSSGERPVDPLSAATDPSKLPSGFATSEAGRCGVHQLTGGGGSPRGRGEGAAWRQLFATLPAWHPSAPLLLLKPNSFPR